jgi:hypothetical protein
MMAKPFRTGPGTTLLLLLLLLLAVSEYAAAQQAQTPRQRPQQQQQQQQQWLEQRERQLEQLLQQLEQRERQIEQQLRQLELQLQQQRAQPAPAPPPQAPVVVEPQPRSADQIQAEQREREERGALNTRLLLLAAVLVAVGVLQLVAFGLQAFYLFLAMRAIQRSTRLAERNLAAAQRAFVFVRSIAAVVMGDHLKVFITWENNGVTPARSLRISTNWKAWHGELPPDFPYAYARAPDQVFLGPQARAEVGSLLIPMRDVQAAADGRVQLYCWGRATYADVFEGTEPHFLEFCYRLDVTSTAPGAVSVSFTQYGPYNRADGDGVRPVMAA